MDSTINLEQFHDIFFEECFEAIEVMEAELLNLGKGEPDPEVIDTIFRAAHSIKGGGGTFGFTEIAQFTHGMETMLDEMREGRLKVSREAITLLLEAVDCLETMVQCGKNKKPYESKAIDELLQKLTVFVSDSPELVPAKETDVPEVTEQALFTTWHISFYPHNNLFYTGNDPLRLIRELQNLGQMEIHVDLRKLPDFSELNVENCYLGWKMVLRGDALRGEVEEIFAWVEGDCDLEINTEEERRKLAPRREDNDQTQPGRRKADVQMQAVQTTSIRVGIEKVDSLVNMVGELVITQSILSSAIGELDEIHREKLAACLEQLERNTRDLQDQAMSIRMLPVDFAFQRLPRIVHDISEKLGKKIELKFSGETTELDKTVLEKIGDPLVHLVRNALDHGIENVDARLAAGKSDTGIISVNAYQQGGNIIIDISDDGAGLNLQKILKLAQKKGLVSKDDDLTDEQIQNLIFEPGFSTAEVVSDISGRGVGMDVVKRNITDLGGMVEVYSQEGKGCTFSIRLPLTLAILDGQMIRIGDQTYIIPLLSIVESLQIVDKQMRVVAGTAEVYQYRGEYIPIIRLHELFEASGEQHSEQQGLLVVIDVGRRRIGLYVDEVVGQQQVVIKSLENNYRHVQGLAGATVLGNGSVALILDVVGLSQRCFNSEVTQKISDASQALH